MQELKQCSSCLEEYPATTEYFFINNKCKNLLNVYCKTCQTRDNLKWKEKNTKKVKYYNLKGKAKSRNIFFDLPFEDFSVLYDEASVCPYLEIPLDKTFGSKDGYRRPGALSFDRIDNSKGYVVGNVEAISALANKMKNNATQEELLLFARNLIRKFDGLPQNLS